MTEIKQPFDEQGHLLCLLPSCRQPIETGDFFVEVRHRRPRDADPKLVVHARCFDRFVKEMCQPSLHRLSQQDEGWLCTCGNLYEDRVLAALHVRVSS